VPKEGPFKGRAGTGIVQVGAVLVKMSLKGHFVNSVGNELVG